MFIKQIFSIVLIFAPNILLASEAPSFLAHFNQSGKLRVEAVNPTYGIPGIIIFNDAEGENDAITSLPRDDEDPEFVLKKVTDTYFGLTCQGRHVAMVDVACFQGDFRTADIYFYLNNGLRESFQTNFNPSMKTSQTGNLLCLAEYSKQTESQYFFKPTQRWLLKPAAKIYIPDAQPFQVKLCSDTIYQLLSKKIKVLVASPSIEASKILTHETSSPKPASSVSAKTIIDKDNGSTHPIITSKYAGTWQRPAGDHDRQLKAALSTEEAYNAEKNPFKRKEVILYQGNELWINIGLANLTYLHHFIQNDMIGRCLSKEDCEILFETWRDKQLAENEDVFIRCNSCQYTHFQACRQLSSAEYSLFVKISPEVRKAIENNAQGFDTSKLEEITQVKIIDKKRTKEIVIIDNKDSEDKNTPSRSNFFTTKTFAGLTFFCALLLLILHHQDVITFSVA